MSHASCVLVRMGGCGPVGVPCLHVCGSAYKSGLDMSMGSVGKVPELSTEGKSHLPFHTVCRCGETCLLLLTSTLTVLFKMRLSCILSCRMLVRLILAAFAPCLQESCASCWRASLSPSMLPLRFARAVRHALSTVSTAADSKFHPCRTGKVPCSRQCIDEPCVYKRSPVWRIHKTIWMAG